MLMKSAILSFALQLHVFLPICGECAIVTEVTSLCAGIAGSADFFRNSYLTIVHMPSARKTKTGWISSIVPRCSHIDHTEHDINIIATEQGRFLLT
jgi:acyl-CoA hydrolase